MVPPAQNEKKGIINPVGFISTFLPDFYFYGRIENGVENT
jgi:hypothetical protein